MLEKAGYPQERVAQLLAKSLVRLEELLEATDVDPFALIAAIKTVARDIAAIGPTKQTIAAPVAQGPATIVIPVYAGRPEPKQVEAKVLEIGPQPSDK